MGRVFFPTYRANILGVRDVGPYAQLGGMDGIDGLEGSIVIPRAPAEPYPRPANNPTQRMLGAVPVSQLIYRGVFTNGGSVGPRIPSFPAGGPLPTPPIVTPPVTSLPVPPPMPAPPIWGGMPIRTYPVYPPVPVPPIPPVAPPVISVPPQYPVVAAPGAPVSPQPPAPAPPVSSQSSPTPVVTMPAQPQTGAILVSSGGGTAAPSTAPITIQTGDTMSAITAWLQGSTPIFNYTVPNVVLAGGVILLFAWLSSGSGKKR
jgi:hypothetical protein